MPSLVECCEQLCQCFTGLFTMTEEQACLYREMRAAIKNKAWAPLNQNLERIEALAREQTRLSKQILELRTQLQQQLQLEEKHSTEFSQLLKISELLPLLPQEQRQQLRKIWRKLRDNLQRRQSEFQVLQDYSQERQKMIQGFLTALRDDELDRGQIYGRAGGQHQPGAAAPARIFNGEA